MGRSDYEGSEMTKMPERPKTRIGRPPKTPPEKQVKRVQIGLFVRADIKRRIDAAAKATGRTLSQEAEQLIERGLMADQIAQIRGSTLEGIRLEVVEAALRQTGHTYDHSPYGKIWYPPGHPHKGSRGGFVNVSSRRQADKGNT